MPTSLRDMLLDLAGGGEQVRLVVGAVQADGTISVAGTRIRPRVTDQARGDLAAGKTALMLRTGAAESAHIVIGTF